MTTEFKNFEQIRTVLENDGVIAFVTDTVWGLGCLPSSEKAVKKIYEIKKRENNKPLILMSNETYRLLDYINPLSKTECRLIKRYFPGALTVVTGKTEKTPDYVTSGLKTAGIRVPDNETFKKICEYVPNYVLATTSANLSHQPSAVTYEQAVKNIGKQADLVVPDFGETCKGLESTVINVIEDKIVILRQGAVTL